MRKDQRTTIWQVPAYLPYVQTKLTDDVLAAAEKKIGARLPNEYVELLQIQNGGYIRFTFLDGLSGQIYGVGQKFPNLLDDLWLVYREYMTIDLEGLYPFDGDGHWHLCLDYRGNNVEPQVTWISTESDTEKVIASSFAKYLEQLTLDTNENFVLETERTLPEMVHELQQVLQMQWTGPDNWAHGYPVYRANWKESVIWLSSNEVPRGFIRPDEDGYEELKAEMETAALRYPELPSKVLLLEVADAAQGVMLQQILAGKGIDLRPLSAYVE